jgi:DNA-binding LacI/PurR family transcriptional regulator
MADVAAAAGVSHQTVSRVLNGHPSVSAATRQRVQAEIEHLGYRRNLAARALVTRSSLIVGVVVSNLYLSGPAGALLGLERAARQRGYWVSVAGLREHSSAEAGRAISHFIDQGVDGVVAIAQTDESLRGAVEAAGDCPLLLITSGDAPAGNLVVDLDQRGGARQAMTLLLGLGHRRIAHVAGPPNDLHARARLTEWRACLERAGLPPGPLVQGDWSSQSGYQAALELLVGPDLPTAVFAGNDHMAIGLLRGFHDAGVAVPGRVSVVGFDDIDTSDCAIPPLTTIRQDHDALGRAGLGLLIDLIEGRQPASALVPAELVVRASAAGPADL